MPSSRGGRFYDVTDATVALAQELDFRHLTNRLIFVGDSQPVLLVPAGVSSQALTEGSLYPAAPGDLVDLTGCRDTMRKLFVSLVQLAPRGAARLAGEE